MLVWLKRLVVPLLIGLVAIQVLQPARTNPPIDSKRERKIGTLADVVFIRVLNRVDLARRAALVA